MHLIRTTAIKYRTDNHFEFIDFLAESISGAIGVEFSCSIERESEDGGENIGEVKRGGV